MDVDAAQRPLQADRRAYAVWPRALLAEADRAARELGVGLVVREVGVTVGRGPAELTARQHLEQAARSLTALLGLGLLRQLGPALLRLDGPGRVGPCPAGGVLARGA